MKYYEIYLGMEYACCFRANKDVSPEEAAQFVKKYDTTVSNEDASFFRDITYFGEITEKAAYEAYDEAHILSMPILGAE